MPNAPLVLSLASEDGLFEAADVVGIELVATEVTIPERTGDALLPASPVRPEDTTGVMTEEVTTGVTTGADESDELVVNEVDKAEEEDPEESKLGGATASEGLLSAPVPQAIPSSVPG